MVSDVVNVEVKVVVLEVVSVDVALDVSLVETDEVLVVVTVEVPVVDGVVVSSTATIEVVATASPVEASVPVTPPLASKPLETICASPTSVIYTSTSTVPVVRRREAAMHFGSK